MDGKKYLKECFLEKIYHFDALAKWNNLEVGSSLTFSPEIEDDEEEALLMLGGSKIGCLSKDDSKDILPFIKQKWGKLFSATIIFKKDDVESENKRIKVAIYINKSKGNAAKKTAK